MLLIITQVLFFLLMPPLLIGLINKVKAWCGGRQGPPILQLYFDLAKLARKGMVLSRTTSWVFLAGPVVGLVTTFFAALVVPLGHNPALLSFAGDFILFSGLLALGRFFTASAALDTGSSFEAMGAAREVTFATLAEPTLFCAFIVLARLSSSLSLSQMVAIESTGNVTSPAAVLALLAFSLLVVLLAENCRIPFDDPNTHLELTMIHEVMVLDHSGPVFGIILYSAAMKLLLTGQLLVDILLPSSLAQGRSGVLASCVGVFVVALVIGLVESNMARLRLLSVPKLLVGAFVSSLFGVMLVLW